MSERVLVKRQYQPIMEVDTMYRELSHPIRKHDTVSHSNMSKQVLDCDTVCPPKKRALFDYNREQGRTISSKENGRTHFQLNKNFEEFSGNQVYSNVNRNRQTFFSNKLKLDRHEHDAEIRPRSDSLHSIGSQFSDMSSIDSTSTSSRESSPVLGEDNSRFDTSHTNSSTCVNKSDSMLHNEEIYRDLGKKSIAKDHETPERNPMLVLNGIKSDIQKPLFTDGSPESADTNKSKPVISKTLFPLNHADTQNIEQNPPQIKNDWSQHYIARKNGESFQYLDIPNPDKQKMSQSNWKNMNTIEGIAKNSSLKTNLSSKENCSYNSLMCNSGKNILSLKDETNRPTEKRNSKSSRILGDVTNSLNISNDKFLKAHVQAEHSGSGSKPYRCEKCNREFSQFNNLRRHMRVHRDKTYKCHLCDRVFNEEFYLKMHVGTHTGQRVYSCGVCNAPFQSNQDLKAHVRTHSPSQLHNCEICGKSFSKACVLRQHKKTHSGDRPHHCTTCGKSFIHRHHLTMHMRSHSDNKPFTCELCSREFSQTSHLYKHLRQHEEENLELGATRATAEYNGASSEPNTVQNRIDSGYESIRNTYTKKTVRKSKKENLENLDPTEAKSNVQGKKSESRTIKNALNHSSKTVRQEKKNRNNQEINGHIDGSVSYHPGGSNTENNKNTNAAKRSFELALNDLDKSMSKKVKGMQQNEDKVASPLTVESNAHLDIQTAMTLSGNSFGTSVTSVPNASTKLPSFHSITSALKESYPYQSATNTTSSVPYYQTPSYEQTLYPYGYPSMSYGSSSKYLAYSAQVQAYYNMLYYNSKMLIDNQYLSSEIKHTKPITNIPSENITKEIKTSMSNIDNSGGTSENGRFNRFWYNSPELTRTVNAGETMTVHKNVDVIDKCRQSDISEKILNRNNPLLMAALKQDAFVETDIRNETHTNKHILKLISLKDRFIEEKPNPEVSTSSESKERNKVCTVSDNTIVKPPVVDHETDRNDLDMYQNVEQSEPGGSKEMKTSRVMQRKQNEKLDNRSTTEYSSKGQELTNINENINKDDTIVEATFESETYSQEKNDSIETKDIGNENIQLSSCFISCDTCSFTFSGKDDLKKHFIQNPACFSKVCETSKISEEFGWQLLDYYLATLEMCKYNRTDNDSDNETKRNASVGDTTGTGTIEQTTGSLVQQNSGNLNCLNERICSWAVESKKTKGPVLLENGSPSLEINESHGPNLANIEQDHSTENMVNKALKEKFEDIGSLTVISRTQSGVENINVHSIEQLHVPVTTSTKIEYYPQETNYDKIKHEKKQETTPSLDDLQHPAEEAELCLGEINVELADVKREESDDMNGNKDGTKQSQIEKESKFMCKFCEAEFEDEEILESHVQTHPTNRPFTCTQCNRNFTHKHHLKRHMMSHSDRCVECHVCKRSFKENYYLQMHMKVHVEHVAQVCEICGESVAKADVSNHVQRHIGPIEGNPTYEQIGDRVKEILKENAEMENEKAKSEVLDLSNKPVTKESLMKMSVEQLKSFMVKGKSNCVE